MIERGSSRVRISYLLVVDCNHCSHSVRVRARHFVLVPFEEAGQTDPRLPFTSRSVDFRSGVAAGTFRITSDQYNLSFFKNSTNFHPVDFVFVSFFFFCFFFYSNETHFHSRDDHSNERNSLFPHDVNLWRNGSLFCVFERTKNREMELQSILRAYRK